jgi:ABC-type dipeptide/oligopeptide/nickel transport system permease component
MTALGRIWFAVVTTFVAATINFFLFRVMPGDAVSALRCRNCTPELHQALLTRYGLDKPLPEQYVTYLGGLARGDLGISLASGKPVLDAIIGPLLNTLPMLTAGTVIALVLGVASGALSAWRRGTALDSASQWTGMACYSMPTQWIALLMVFYVASALGLPAVGLASPTLGILGEPSWWDVLADRTAHLILPALALGVGTYGQYAIVVRSAMLDTLGQDYILTARAKGLRDWMILRHYAFGNAMLPLITIIALSAGSVVAGAIVVEDVFSYPGIGFAAVDAIDKRDYPVLQGIFLLLTVSVVLANLIADLIYVRVDPRIRYGHVSVG